MYPHTHLLGLPRELRQAIYKEYVAIEGGLIHKPEHGKPGKLWSADDEPIDMALMLTCSAIAEETKGLYFDHNAITVLDFYSEQVQLPAGRFGVMMLGLYLVETEMLHNALPILTSQVANEADLWYPTLKPSYTTSEWMTS